MLLLSSVSLLAHRLVLCALAHSPDLQQIVLGHVGGQDVFQQYLVDAPHGVDALLLAAELGAPQEVGARGPLGLAV